MRKRVMLLRIRVYSRAGLGVPIVIFGGLGRRSDYRVSSLIIRDVGFDIVVVVISLYVDGGLNMIAVWEILIFLKWTIFFVLFRRPRVVGDGVEWLVGIDAIVLCSVVNVGLRLSVSGN